MAVVRRVLSSLTGSVTAIAVTLLGAPVVLAAAEPAATSAPRSADPTGTTGLTSTDKLRLVAGSKPHRKIKRYVVRKGDTPSEVATRYHAWTDELIAMNGRVLHVGETIRIPVVVKRSRACTRHRHHFTGYYGNHSVGKAGKADKKKAKPHKPKNTKPKAAKPTKSKKPEKNKRPHAHKHPDKGWVHANASQSEVRRIIVKRARYHGVNPNLALAVAWMESGWQQKRKSSAGALGAMQVLPSTGEWMSAVVGRKLNLRNLHDNVTAGVVLLKLLRQQAGPRHAIAGYYQGLAGVRRYGMYRSTKRYVANVVALRERLAKGWSPI
jgi:LysM repeat protein